MQQKRFLQAVEHRRTRRQSFYRRNVTSRNLSRGNQARANRLAVEQHRAGAAVAGIAADFCSGQPEIVAQDTREAARTGSMHLDGATVH